MNFTCNVKDLNSALERTLLNHHFDLKLYEQFLILKRIHIIRFKKKNWSIYAYNNLSITKLNNIKNKKVHAQII